MMKTHEYDAIAFKQSSSSEWIVSFNALAEEIDAWGGIPQKKSFDSVESSGFQRVVKEERMKSLVNFYSDSKNIIQNPLLCASRNSQDRELPGVFFTTESQDEYTRFGRLTVVSEDFSSYTLTDLLKQFKSSLEARVTELRELVLDQSLLEQLKLQFSESEGVADANSEQKEELGLETSHMQDLWQEVSCRIAILEENQSFEEDSILGFDRESITSYLQPVNIVDGQHRLKGALAYLEDMMSSPEAVRKTEELISSGTEPDIADSEVKKHYERRLPVSLVLCDDPAEHVFQFVVVNQKATPINNALLGTIVSTTLSEGELERVSQRLKNADIPLDDSRAVSFATRNTRSPFYQLVQTGISGEQSGKLPWTVMKSLVTIFKELKGAKFFGSPYKNDFADVWKKKLLVKSDIVDADSLDSAYARWRDEDGVWKEVFVTFWTKVRDYFGSLEDEYRSNYWGHTRSNLYNKISLTILAADFFKFISDGRGIAISDIQDLEEIIDDWLLDVDRSYFDRDWLLKGEKKDSPMIREQWSTLWVTYRTNPQRLPSVSSYASKFGK
ncbi:hypothetical protein NB545_14095 [Vibrio campbellii]|uniref:hypothetical protein n=1 Tax=Vibrio TaxID=662 RepID=UPI002076187C|nr:MULTISPECIES: hypothetical protein [Vibrio]MCR9908579.1 hypothetical protein [Vibrio campbellii]USD50782.1 hypothetical protein J4N37_04190 [Vibrio sp. SCSIO 43153]